MYIRKICQTWRVYGDDIRDEWSSVKPVIEYWGSNDIAKYSSPGSFNMADFLTPGQGGNYNKNYNKNNNNRIL